MEAGLYLSGTSALHRADPRLKIAGVVGLSILITTINQVGLICLTIGILVLLGLNQIPLKAFKSVFYAVLFIGSFYALVLSWNWSDAWRFWQGEWSKEGLLQATIIIWRISLVFVITRAFVGVTLPSEQGVGIAYFFTPFYRFSPIVADLALLITLTLRFIPLLVEDGSLLYKARIAKGGIPLSLPKRIMELASLLLPLLLLTLRRAEELAENLVARGYISGGYRVLGTKEWERSDTVWAFILSVWGIMSLVLDIMFM